MYKIIPHELKEIKEAVPYRPAVSVYMPFDPKMGLKTEIINTIKIATDEVEQELQRSYSGEMVMLIMSKLRAIIQKLDFNTHKKSIAIYVSPVFEKVLYLDIMVEKKIIIDESSEIRDLVYSKKQLHKCLVLLLSGKESQIFLGNTNRFIKILSNTPEKTSPYLNDTSEKGSNSLDISTSKEIMMDKFLHHIDNSLGIILKAYLLPLFVLGTEEILRHFKSFSQHAGAVIEYLPGDYEETSLSELKTILEPYVSDWKKVLQKDVLNQMEDATEKKKLAVGMQEVWQEAMKRKGRLLVVEKNYLYAAQHGSREEMIFKTAEPYNKFYMSDAVDDVIEKVLENGGDVEFVDNGVLKDFRQIALVLFY